MTIVHDLMKEPLEQHQPLWPELHLGSKTKKLEAKASLRPSLMPSTNQMTSEGFFHVGDESCP
jgi:hypothetical protein